MALSLPDEEEPLPPPWLAIELDAGRHIGRVMLVGRGEVAYCQLGRRALLAETLPSPAVIFAESIRRWHDGAAVTASEREAVVALLTASLRALGASHVEVVPHP